MAGKLVVHDAGLLLNCAEKSREEIDAAVVRLIESWKDRDVSLSEALPYFWEQIKEEQDRISIWVWFEHRFLPYAAKEDVRVAPMDPSRPPAEDSEAYAAWRAALDIGWLPARSVQVELFRDTWNDSGYDWLWDWRGEHPETGYNARIMNGGLLLHHGNTAWSMHT